MWWLFWLLFLLLFLVVPLGYGGGYRGWGAPRPYYYRRRASADYYAWSWLADLVWLAFLVLIVWLLIALFT